MTQKISFDCTRATTTRVHTIFVDIDILIKVHYKRERKKKDKSKNGTNNIFAKWTLQNTNKFGGNKKKTYLCTMKQEIEKYLQSETELNKQSFHTRKLAIKICISILCIGIILLIFGIIMLIKSI